MYYTSGEAVRIRPDSEHQRGGALAAQARAPRRRRVFHCTAGIKLARWGKALYLKATLLSEEGVYVLHESPLPQNEACTITLSMFIGGKRVMLAAEGQTGEPICAGATFRIGIRFTHLDENDNLVLARLLRE